MNDANDDDDNDYDNVDDDDDEQSTSAANDDANNNNKRDGLVDLEASGADDERKRRARIARRWQLCAMLVLNPSLVRHRRKN